MKIALFLRLAVVYLHMCFDQMSTCRRALVINMYSFDTVSRRRVGTDNIHDHKQN